MLVIGVVTCHAAPASERLSPIEVDWTRPNDTICGPKCVQHVLEYYGCEEDVIKLVREMQWPKIESGVSLEKVADALSARNVHCLPMRISQSADLQWEHPIIAHLDVDDSDIGHFVVWLPSTTAGEVRLWCGESGTIKVNRHEWCRIRSGAVLLTAPKPLVVSDVNVTRMPLTLIDRWLTASALTLASGLVVSHFFLRSGG